MPGLLTQINIFFLTLFLGVIVGIIIHYYQLSIRALKVGKYMLYLLDFILWLLMILVVSLGMLVINQGALRVYTLLFLIVGGYIYFKMLAPHVYRPLRIVAEANAVLLRKTASFFIKPGQRLIKTIGFQWRIHHPRVPPEDP